MAQNDDVIVVMVDTTSPDLDLVDALARLQLMARRVGCSIKVSTGGELRDLLELVGMTDVLALEPRRETKERKELGVEEVVESGDAPL